MPRTMKRLTMAAFIVLLSAATTFTVIIVLAGFFTTVPAGFDVISWRKVQDGMSKNEVLLLLPQPIDRCIACDAASCAEYWRYSRRTSSIPFYMDYKIFFNERGQVIGKKNRIDCD